MAPRMLSKMISKMISEVVSKMVSKMASKMASKMVSKIVPKMVSKIISKMVSKNAKKKSKIYHIRDPEPWLVNFLVRRHESCILEKTQCGLFARARQSFDKSNRINVYSLAHQHLPTFKITLNGGKFESSQTVHYSSRKKTSGWVNSTQLFPTDLLPRPFLMGYVGASLFRAPVQTLCCWCLYFLAAAAKAQMPNCEESWRKDGQWMFSNFNLWSEAPHLVFPLKYEPRGVW